MVSKLRKRIIEVAYRDGMGHIPSALSILDIIWVLYDKVMAKDDQFILSKGHGCMALYAVLEEKGLFDWSTKAQGHPKRGGAIMASTGSLGHGLPMALGLAKAKQIKGEKGRVYCLIGDGECNEGTTWESAMLAAHHKLNNLVVIVDQNHSSDRALDTGRLDNKFNAFGLESRTIHGHIASGLKTAFEIMPSSEHPICWVCKTTKGHGVPLMESDPSWHNRKLTREEYEHTLSIL